MLAFNEQPKQLSFLWARTKGAATALWIGIRLTNVLAKEFKEHLDTEVAILLWRHAAIVISRRHLRQVKFSKDYGIKTRQTWNDVQAGHLSHLASTVYARRIEEAPGHVALARASNQPQMAYLPTPPNINFDVFAGSIKHSSVS
jgi:hypothetical protein